MDPYITAIIQEGIHDSLSASQVINQAACRVYTSAYVAVVRHDTAVIKWGLALTAGCDDMGECVERVG